MLKLVDELFLQFIKKYSNLNEYDAILEDITVANTKDTESLINGFEKISLFSDRAVVFFESKLKEELLRHLYLIDNPDLERIEKGFVEHSVNEFFADSLGLNKLQGVSTGLAGELYQYAAHSKLLSCDIYICIDKSIVNNYLTRKHSIEPQKGVSTKLLKSIVESKKVQIDIGLLNQSVDMADILNIKVGDVIKTTRRKEEGVQIIYGDEVLASNVFVSSGEKIKVIVG